MVSPARDHPDRSKRTPCGSSLWWRTCSFTACSQSSCQLGRPADRCRLTGGQLRPTDKAMAARSARKSSSEEDARSSDEEDRSLTKRCIERQWKNTCLRVKRLPCDHKSDGQSRSPERRSIVGSVSQCSTHCQGDAHTGLGQRPGDVVFPEKQTCLTTVHATHVPLGFLRLNGRKRRHHTFQKQKTTPLPWSCGHVHPCCCLRFRRPATAPSLCTCTRAVARRQNLLINCGDSTLLFWPSFPTSDDDSSPARGFSVSARSQSTLSTSTPRSPCRRFVSILTLAISCFFAAVSPAWLALLASFPFWESARSAVMLSFNFCRIPVISPLSRAYPP